MIRSGYHERFSRDKVEASIVAAGNRSTTTSGISSGSEIDKSDVSDYYLSKNPSTALTKHKLRPDDIHDDVTNLDDVIRTHAAVTHCTDHKHHLSLRAIQAALEEDSDDSDDEEDQSDDVNYDVSFRRHVYRMSRKRRRPIFAYRNVAEQINELMRSFILTDKTCVDIKRLLDRQMTYGLHDRLHHLSTLKMLPTYVRCLPDNTEYGRYLTLDLGGTNFRVMLVELKGAEKPETSSQLFLIPKSIMLGEGTQLFDHLATCIAQFVREKKVNGLPLGFTFSFPCHQAGLASARLLQWTKGFRCSGVEGQDVVRMLHDAVSRRKDIDVECCAVINDPVGALMSCAHSDNNCRIGLILGTGTNCCYMERLENVQRWEGDYDEPKQVIVNTEWGAFGDNGVLEFIRTKFDRHLDKNSLNPGLQLFEKMISGMYMGEIVRNVMCHLTSDGLLFGGEGSQELSTPYSFLTKYMSEIESDDPDGSYSNTKLVLQELDVRHFTIDDCRHVQHVCGLVSRRAAYLAATGVATVISRVGREEVTVAVDGSLYRFHPHFETLMNEKIASLVEPTQKFLSRLTLDGSGEGAALVAAVARRMARKTKEQTLSETQ